MSTITKEQLRERARQKVKSLELAVTQSAFADSRAELEEELELARIALASLEAEAVAWLYSASFERGHVEGELTDAPGCDMPVYTVPPVPVSVPDYPETLPCPVMLEPGLRFGKGVLTKTMLGALQRRAEYYAELEAMTPEQRAKNEAGMKEFAAMLQGADGALTNEDTKRVDELVMWIKRLAHSLRKANPDSKLQSDAMDYLSRKGLIGVEDILR